MRDQAHRSFKETLARGHFCSAPLAWRDPLADPQPAQLGGVLRGFTPLSEHCGPAFSTEGRDGPILLQKSFCTGDRKFCGPWTRVSVRCEGPHRVATNSQATLVMRLGLYESA